MVRNTLVTLNRNQVVSLSGISTQGIKVIHVNDQYLSITADLDSIVGYGLIKETVQYSTYLARPNEEVSNFISFMVYGDDPDNPGNDEK